MGRMFILTGEEILKKCYELNKELWEVALMYELSLGNKTKEMIYKDLDLCNRCYGIFK